MTVARVYNAAKAAWEEISGGLIAPSTQQVGFSAHNNGVNLTNQGNASTTCSYNKVSLSTTDWNIGGFFDGSKFMPAVAGKYLIIAAIQIGQAFTDQYYAVIYKNGSIHKIGDVSAINVSGCWPKGIVSCVVDFNGVSDYIELYGLRAAAGQYTISGSSPDTYFQAVLLQPALLTSAIPVDLSSASSDYILKIGETAVVNFTNKTSVPLRVATGQGIYELIITNQDQSTASITNTPMYLLPNNVTVPAGDINMSRINQYGSTISGAEDTSAQTSFYIGLAPNLINSKSKIYTYLKNKLVEGTMINKSAADQSEILILHQPWFNYTTAWASLGTLSCATAFSGTAVIRRIL